MSQVTGWWGISLPYRTCGFYELFEPDRMPPIKIDPIFADIKTIADVIENRDMIEHAVASTTACYVPIGEEDDLNEFFYNDQQGCVRWYFRDGVGVYTNEKLSQVVAPDIPTFLTRLKIENSIWHKIMMSRFAACPFGCDDDDDYDLSKLDQTELEYVNYLK